MSVELLRRSLFKSKSHENEPLPSWFRPSMAPSSSSSRRHAIAPVLVEFDGWDRGKIFDWYKKLPTTTFKRMELWKEREDFKHEFVVVHMTENIIFRVERRPYGGATPEAILTRGCRAEDSITPVTNADLAALHSKADVQLAVDFNAKKPDFYGVIAVCVAVQLDEESKNYTLQQYNCYFLARTIIVLIVRHYLIASLDDIRWDNFKASAVEKYISGSDQDALDAVMKNAVVEALDTILWPIVKADAETLIDERKDWTELRRLTKEVITEVVTKIQKLSTPVESAFIEWVSEATQETLWHGNVEKHISESGCKSAFERATKHALVMHASHELQSKLPRQMVIKFEPVLPKRFVERIPTSVIARLPIECLARIPAHVVAKAPDGFVLNVPNNFLAIAPVELIQRAPDELFARGRNSLLLSCPEAMGRLPDRVAKIVLERLKKVLDEPLDYPDRPLGINFLRRLPEGFLNELPEKYRIQAAETIEQSAPMPNQVADGSGTVPAAPPSEEPSPSETPPRSRRFSIFGLAIRAVPRPIFARLPCIISLVPTSWLRSVQPEAIANIPPQYFAKIPRRCMEKLPPEIFENIPTSVLRTLPRIAIERIPESLLEKIPTPVLGRIPVELIENVPENVSDLLHQALAPDTFSGSVIKEEMEKHVRKLVDDMLKSPDSLPKTIIQVSARSRSRLQGIDDLKVVQSHEAFQNFILDMIRRHSKKVSKVASLGLGEYATYNGLCDKMDAIWCAMRLHTRPWSHSARLLR